MTQRISIEASFQSAQRFVAREWRLALPVMLAFLMLPPFAINFALPPDLARALTTPQVADMSRMQPVLALLLPLAVLILLCAAVGTLAIMALAIRARLSVGESLALGLRRLPVLVGAALLLFLGLVAATTVGTVVTQVSGLDAVRAQGLLVVTLAVGMIALMVRLALLGPVIVERRVGPIDAIATSWRMGRGNFLRMLGTLLIYFIGASIVLLALNTAVSATLLLLGRAIGAPEVGIALAALFYHLGGAVLNTGTALLAASFYRQLAVPSSGT